METEKTMFLQVKRLIQIIFKFGNEKKLGQKNVHISTTHQTSF